jgi:hypothetical protein
MQQLPPDTETYGRGCCAGGIFLLFVPMFIGMLYSFGAFRRRRKGENGDGPSPPQPDQDRSI